MQQSGPPCGAPYNAPVSTAAIFGLSPTVTGSQSPYTTIGLHIVQDPSLWTLKMHVQWGKLKPSVDGHMGEWTVNGCMHA